MLHEAGHFIAAKRSGMKVTEYFLGFGPRLWSFTRGETEYGIKAIPLGGYVRIIGMNGEEVVAPEDEPRTYRQGSYRNRLIVVLAGVTVNFLLAFALFFVVLAWHGTTGSPNTTVSSVVAKSAAKAAGLRVGDRIVAVQGTSIPTWNKLKAAIEARGGQATTFTVVRDGHHVEVEATPKVDSNGDGFLGVSPSASLHPVGVVRAAPESAKMIWTVIDRTGAAVGGLFSPSGVSNYSKNFTSSAPASGTASNDRLISIVGVVALGSQIVNGNIWNLLLLLGLLNIAVALINLVPLPPFDGGHAAIVVYEWAASKVRRRPVRADYKKLAPVTAVVLAIFLTISLSAMFLDIRDAIGH
jgi:RIP metalloprotease RseP